MTNLDFAYGGMRAMIWRDLDYCLRFFGVDKFGMSFLKSGNIDENIKLKTFTIQRKFLFSKRQMK